MFRLRLPSLGLMAIFLSLSLQGPCETVFFAITMKGKSVGFAQYTRHFLSVNGQKALKTESRTHLALEMEGDNLDIDVVGSTVTSLRGLPILIRIEAQSGGKTQTVQSKFGNGIARIVSVNNGKKTEKNISIPSGALVTDDPIGAFIDPQNKVKKFLVLDPTTLTFVTNTVQRLANRRVHNAEMQILKLVDPRSNSIFYLDKKNKVLEIDAPLGMIMKPVSRAVALRVQTSRADVSIGSKISPSGHAPDDIYRASRVQVEIHSETDLSSVRSDDHQTVTRLGSGWIFDIHPTSVEVPSRVAIEDAFKAQSEWVKPDLNVPSDSTRFKNLAKKIVHGETDVALAARLIQSYVYKHLQGDAGMGLLRDANDVLDSGRGVCRDYAILAATLLRAAQIPTRMVTGLVSWDGDFYYHAWVEFFNGHHWVGLDSTTDEPQISAGHLKLATGTVEQAFLPPFLENPRIQWVSKTPLESH